MAKHFQKVEGEINLYLHEKIYYIRDRRGGKDTHVSLKTTKIGEARRLRNDYQAVKRSRALGLAAPQPKKEEAPTPPKPTLRTILSRYRDDGHPDKRGNKRPEGDHLRQERASLIILDSWFGEREWDALNQNVLDQFHDDMTKQVNPDGKSDQWRQGHRSTDLHLNCLSNALNWAIRKGLISQNPIVRKIKYHRPSEARHAKDVAPQGPEEMHKILDVIFEDPRSEALGFQAAYEWLTGQRTTEALQLRTDAHEGEPGYIMKDSLRVRRADKADRENPFAHIHSGLKAFIKAHRKWHKKRYPSNPFWFPGRDKSEGKPADPGSLTRLLEELRKKRRLKRKITSHGLRGGYVLVRRSWGIPDTQIAWECNQIGGVKTLEQSYGGVPPHWRDGKGPKLAWLPKGRKPAWDAVLERLKASAKKVKQAGASSGGA